MSAKIDITGQRFGRLVAIEPTLKRSRSSGSVVWKCKCDCGNMAFVSYNVLHRSNTRSCGCLRNESAGKTGRVNRIDISGRRFGRLTAIAPTNKRSGSNIEWECLCDCGELTLVSTASLARETVRSCGCLKDATRFTRNTNVNPMDVPFAVTNIIRTRRELKRVIKQAV